MKQRLWRPGRPTPGVFPSDEQITHRAVELFFKDRVVPREYAEYRRQAESELLERAFRQLATARTTGMRRGS